MLNQPWLETSCDTANVVLLTTDQDSIFAISCNFTESPLSSRYMPDNITHMHCWHSRYNLGDRKPSSYVNGLAATKDLIDKYAPKTIHSSNSLIDNLTILRRLPNLVFKSLRLYDHSDISISTSLNYPYNDRWDSSEIGYVFVDLNEVAEQYSGSKTQLRDWAEKQLEREVQFYNAYLQGLVYTVTLFTTDQQNEYAVCPHCGKTIVTKHRTVWKPVAEVDNIYANMSYTNIIPLLSSDLLQRIKEIEIISKKEWSCYDFIRKPNER